MTARHKASWRAPDEIHNLFSDGHSRSAPAGARGNNGKRTVAQVWSTRGPVGLSVFVGAVLYVVNAIQIANERYRADFASDDDLFSYTWSLLVEIVLHPYDLAYQASFLLGLSVTILTASISFIVFFEIEKVSSSTPGFLRRLLTLYLIVISLVLVFGHLSVIADISQRKGLSTVLRYAMVPVTLIGQVTIDYYIASVFHRLSSRFAQTARYYAKAATISLCLVGVGLLIILLSMSEKLADVATNSHIFFGIEIILACTEFAIVYRSRFVRENVGSR